MAVNSSIKTCTYKCVCSTPSYSLLFHQSLFIFALLHCLTFSRPRTSPFPQPSRNNPNHLAAASCPDGGRPGGPAGLSAGQISRDRGVVCELGPGDSDTDQGGELHDEDEFGDPTICRCVTAETGYAEKEQQQITGGYYTVLPICNYITLKEAMLN